MKSVCESDELCGSSEDSEGRRELFIKEITPLVELAQSIGFSQIHFHTKDVRSFYRSQSPDRYGDRLEEFRYSVKITNETKKPFYGLEEGRVINGFRYVYPLFVGVDHIGSVGFSVSSQMMQKELADLYSGAFWIIFDKEIIKSIVFEELFEKTYKTTPFDDRFVVEIDIGHRKELEMMSKNLSFKDKEVFSSYSPFYVQGVVDDRSYVVLFYPMKNIAGIDIGYLVHSKEDETIANIEKAFLYYALSFTLFWFFVILFFYILKKKHSELFVENLKRIGLEKELRVANKKLSGVLEDETKERKKQQDLVNTIFENAPVGISIIDEEGVIKEANPCLCKMLGFEREELVEKSSSIVNDTFEEMKNIADDFVRLETTYKKKDGTAILVRYTGTFIKGQKRYILGIIEDITEARALETSRKKQEQMLIQQSKMAAMGEMIGAIAHQWRQPLSVLSLLVQNIEDAYENGTFEGKFLHESVRKSMVQIEYMAKTIDDFRNFYRPQKNAVIFEIKAAIEQVKTIIGMQFDHNDIVLNIKQDEKKVLIKGHKNEFEQVILNLLTNAKDSILQRREEGGEKLEGVVTVSIGKRDKLAVIEICDNGVGVEKELLQKLFEPYFTTKSDEKGTGIGLYMSRLIIEGNMGGVIYFKDEVEEGTCVVLEIEEAEIG